MKLYIYEHCPFSARVRFVASALNIIIDIVTLDYDDDKTTTAIMGSKQVPVLVKDDGQAIAESLDIIKHFLVISGSLEPNTVSKWTLEWQQEAFLPLQKIGYPRWTSLALKEFERDSAKQTWRNKKESNALHFPTLLANTSIIAKEVEGLIDKAATLLKPNSEKKIALIDEAILFSILRGFFSAQEIKWPPFIEQWMRSMSKKSNISLLI